MCVSVPPNLMLCAQIAFFFFGSAVDMASRVWCGSVMATRKNAQNIVEKDTPSWLFG